MSVIRRLSLAASITASAALLLIGDNPPAPETATKGCILLRRNRQQPVIAVHRRFETVPEHIPIESAVIAQPQQPRSALAAYRKSASDKDLFGS